MSLTSLHSPEVLFSPLNHVMPVCTPEQRLEAMREMGRQTQFGGNREDFLAGFEMGYGPLDYEGIALADACWEGVVEQRCES